MAASYAQMPVNGTTQSDASQSGHAEEVKFFTRRIKQLQDSLECALRIADIVCTTPHACRSKPYLKLHNAAKAVILDDAGAMHRINAILVVGDTLRPLAMTDNERHLPPTVMTSVQKVDGHRVNTFADHGKISILEPFSAHGSCLFCSF